MDYVAYGLRVRSSVPLPFASPRTRASAAAPPPPDVTVRFGAVPATLRAPVNARRRTRDGMEWEHASGVFLLHMRGIARYLVMKSEVLVEPCCRDDRGIGEVLAQMAWTAVLLLRRSGVPFHASAVAFEAGAVLFLGHSGVGKSSLLGTFLKRGHAMLADDAVGVASSSDSRILALPSFPRLRLCADTLDALGWREQALGQAWRSDKHLAPVRCFRASPLPICSLYLLADSHNRSGIQIEKVRSVSALKMLGPYVWHKRLVHSLGRSECFRTLTAMARQAPVAQVARPAHPLRLDALADRIEAHMRETVP